MTRDAFVTRADLVSAPSGLRAFQPGLVAIAEDGETLEH